MVRFGQCYQKVNPWCFFYSRLNSLIFLFIILKLIFIFIKALYQFIASYRLHLIIPPLKVVALNCLRYYFLYFRLYFQRTQCVFTSCLSIADIAYLFHILQLKSHITLHHHNHHHSLFLHLLSILTSEFLVKSVMFVCTLCLFFTHKIFFSPEVSSLFICLVFYAYIFNCFQMLQQLCQMPNSYISKC